MTNYDRPIIPSSFCNYYFIADPELDVVTNDQWQNLNAKFNMFYC